MTGPGWQGAVAPGWMRPRRPQISDLRGARTHVVILDGTNSKLVPGRETNAGQAYLLLKEAGQASLYYEPGLQWANWRDTRDVALGRGINRQIKRAYGYLAARYRPGDRIVLMGYSRGAYAVRSLAGVIGRVGLLRADQATERSIRQAYRLYDGTAADTARDAFRSARCHRDTTIEMIGVWDTVKALGLRLPVVWRWMADAHAFHDSQLGAHVTHGFHALARDERRVAYSPVLWDCPPGWQGHVEQVWFRGTHADVGGQLNGFEAARPLANIPLVWMLERLEACEVALPPKWRSRFLQDVGAVSAGPWRGVAKLFLYRRQRRMLVDPSESLHGSITGAGAASTLAHATITSG